MKKEKEKKERRKVVFLGFSMSMQTCSPERHEVQSQQDAQGQSANGPAANELGS